MLTQAQMKYATERLAEIPETDREPVLDVLRAELPRHGRSLTKNFARLCNGLSTVRRVGNVTTGA